MNTNNSGNIILSDRNKLLLQGNWTLLSIPELEHKIAKLNQATDTDIAIHGHDITAMDTAGAWLFHRLLKNLENQSKKITILGLNTEYQQLLTVIDNNSDGIDKIPALKKTNFLAHIGRLVLLGMTLQWLNFIGELFIASLSLLRHPSRIRWQYFFNIVEQNGYRALMLVGFLSFLIGVVLTYQTGLELRLYGANIFIINLLGLATFREFAPLITAIIIAGSNRTRLHSTAWFNEGKSRNRRLANHGLFTVTIPSRAADHWYAHRNAVTDGLG